MPIVGLLWPDEDVGVPNSSDVHVVRGHVSPSLLDRLQVADTSGKKISAAKYIKNRKDNNQPIDVTFAFQPLFVGVLLPDGKYKGLGVSVDMGTGVVDVDAPDVPGSAFTPFNFIIEITATASGTELPKRFVRVQAHGALKRVWLTPGRLTVRRPPPLRPDPFPPGDSPPPDPRDTHMRFVVRAQFDDNVIGDLTLESGTTWGPNSNVNKPDVNNHGRLLVDPDDLPDAEIEITATLDARFGGPAAARSATATMVVKKGWHQLAPAQRPVIELVNGSGVPKKDRPETLVPNVVLMADGWGRAVDSAEFVRLTREILSTLRRSRLLRPYPHLVDSMCFWEWIVPPPPPAPGSKPVEGAFSVLSEVYLFKQEGELFASVMPFIMFPPETGKLRLESLLYVVGLPMPDETRTVGDLRRHWKTTCLNFVDSRVDNNVIAEWLKLRSRTFVHCVDTEFHIGYGELPSVEPLVEIVGEIPPPTFFGFPTVFQGFESLNGALTVLTTKATVFSGRPLGELWTDPGALPTGVEPPRFDNRRYVMCFVPLAGARSHAKIGGTQALISTRHQYDGFRVKPSADPERGGHEVVGEGLTDDVEALFYVFVHELTHCFGLGDEYADDTRKFSGAVPEYPNLQGDIEVRDAAGQISGNLIRWKWHRIQAAAMIEKEISTQDGFFAIDVHPGLATQFSLKQEVLLRLRKFRKPFILEPMVLGFPLLIEKIVGDHRLLVSPTKSTDLEALQAFKPGSIVFLPIKAPAAINDSSYPYMQLITRQIRDRITNDKAPLWAAASEPDNLQGTQKPKLRELSPLLLRCPKNTWRVIGLYEGGIQSASGIYHPAGGCLMRSSKELCAVCRYVLTDVIDPSLHNANEAVYGEIYTPD